MSEPHAHAHAHVHRLPLHTAVAVTVTVTDATPRHATPHSGGSPKRDGTPDLWIRSIRGEQSDCCASRQRRRYGTKGVRRTFGHFELSWDGCQGKIALSTRVRETTGTGVDD
jgi:hypothetical protein